MLRHVSQKKKKKYIYIYIYIVRHDFVIIMYTIHELHTALLFDLVAKEIFNGDTLLHIYD